MNNSIRFTTWQASWAITVVCIYLTLLATGCTPLGAEATPRPNLSSTPLQGEETHDADQSIGNTTATTAIPPNSENDIPQESQATLEPQVCSYDTTAELLGENASQWRTVPVLAELDAQEVFGEGFPTMSILERVAFELAGVQESNTGNVLKVIVPQYLNLNDVDRYLEGNGIAQTNFQIENYSPEADLNDEGTLLVSVHAGEGGWDVGIWADASLQQGTDGGYQIHGRLLVNAEKDGTPVLWSVPGQMIGDETGANIYKVNGCELNIVRENADGTVAAVLQNDMDIFNPTGLWIERNGDAPIANVGDALCPELQDAINPNVYHTWDLEGHGNVVIDSFAVDKETAPIAELLTPEHWNVMSEETLFDCAPEREGFAKERVVGHDTGRYISYRNQESGRVEWVFNTEVQEFERGAESVWKPVVGENGETSEIRTLVVTSKKLEEMFHGYFKIEQEDGEKLSRYVAVNCAVNWYSQLNPERFQGTASMSDAQKRALVEESLAQYLQQVIRTGSRIELHGQDVNPNQMIFKFDYRQGVTGSNLLSYYGERAVRYSNSQGSESNLVVAMRSGQNMLQYMQGQTLDENFNIVDLRAYWVHGPLVLMGNVLIENDRISGRIDDIFSREETQSSLYNQILTISFGDGNYTPEVDGSYEVNANNYTILPSLHGDWVVGDWISGSNR